MHGKRRQSLDQGKKARLSLGEKIAIHSLVHSFMNPYVATPDQISFANAGSASGRQEGYVPMCQSMIVVDHYVHACLQEPFLVL